MVLTTFIKYLLHTIDLQSENPWDNKAVYMLYTELFTGIECQRRRSLFLSARHTIICVVLFEMPATLRHLFFFFSYSRLYQSAPVHCLYDHHDKGPHLPPVCHPAHVSGYEVSGCMLVTFTLQFVFFSQSSYPSLFVYTLHEMGI